MTRPRLHPLALLLGFAIFDTLVWINANDNSGFLFSTITTHYGWPCIFLETENLELRTVRVVGLVLNLIVWFALIVLPGLALNCLLLRTLHIHLATAFALMLAAAALVYLNVQPGTMRIDTSIGPFETLHHAGWPSRYYMDIFDLKKGAYWSYLHARNLPPLSANILSALALLSEKILSRRRPPSAT